MYTYICGNIINNNDERTHIPLTLYSWKGCKRVDVSCVWEVSWRRNRLPHIDPKFLRPSQHFFLILLGCSTRVLRAQALCLELVLTLQATTTGTELQLELQLPQTVCGTWLYNCLTPTCFLWASHLHWIQPVHRSRWYSDIFDQMHLFLDWRFSRRSICYIYTPCNQPQMMGSDGQLWAATHLSSNWSLEYM